MISKLQQIREKKGISQRKLEQLSGVHQQTISRIEKGTPLTKLSTIKKLADALGCKQSDIADLEDEFNKLSEHDFKNVHNYLKATRELLNINPRRLANFLEITEREYLDYEDKNNDVSVDEAMSISTIMMFCWASSKIADDLKAKAHPADLSEIEVKALKALRALSPEDQERFISLIGASSLLK